MRKEWGELEKWRKKCFHRGSGKLYYRRLGERDGKVLLKSSSAPQKHVIKHCRWDIHVVCSIGTMSTVLSFLKPSKFRISWIWKCFWGKNIVFILHLRMKWLKAASSVSLISTYTPDLQVAFGIYVLCSGLFILLPLGLVLKHRLRTDSLACNLVFHLHFC